VDVLDVVVVLLVVLAATRGLRLGAAIQLVSFCGFLLGLVFGAVLVALVEPHVHGQLLKTFVALVLLMVPATLVAGLGRQLGVRAWRVLRQFRFGPLDAAGGALIAIAGTLVVCWLFASILVNSAFPAVSRQIADSRIIRGVEAVLPPVPDAFAAVQRYLSTSGFPQVLVNILPENDGPVSLPSAAQLQSAVARAGGATVKVVAIGCGQEQEGSGFVASPDLVVTNAHVVAGTSDISVDLPDGRVLRAVPVFFDPRFDLAILQTPALGVPPLRIDPNFVERGTAAVVLGYPGGGNFTSDRAGIFARFDAEGRDIYGNALTIRTVYSLQAVVRPGNSGGPLVTPGGEVIGVVFSRSASNPDIGYALASPGVVQRLHRAEAHPVATGTDGCTG